MTVIYIDDPDVAGPDWLHDDEELAVHRGDELAFNPNQPRDGDGRWTDIAGALAPLAEPDGGFTVSPSDLTVITTGYAVALGGTDKLIIASDGFSKGKATPALKRLVVDRIDVAVATPVPEGTRRALGGWHNPADGKVEVNVTAVFPPDQREQALQYARDNDQNRHWGDGRQPRHRRRPGDVNAAIVEVDRRVAASRTPTRSRVVSR